MTAPASRLGFGPILLAVLAVIGAATVIATHPDQTRPVHWIGGAVLFSVLLLACEWWQRRQLIRSADRAIDALIDAEAELRERERQLQNHVARQAKILRMEREIAGSDDTAFVALTAARAASTVSAARQVSVWTFDHEGASMRLLAQSNWDRAGQERGRWIPVAEGPIGAAIAERQPIGAEVDGSTHWVWPLVVGNRIIGVMEVVEGSVAVDDAIGDAVSTLAIHAASALEAARLHTETRELARIDPLTRLPNRRSFDEDLERSRELARRHGHPVALIMIDLDHFKVINDTYGHPFGDEVLQRVAEALQAVLRRSDTAYRLGGEEFGVLARETDLKGAQLLAERLRVEIESTVGTGEAGRPTITASFGVAELGTREPDTAMMVSAADMALYDAKRGGRNRVVVVTPTTGTAAST